MEVTIGEHLDVQSVETYIEQWLRSKKATGTSSGTLSKGRQFEALGFRSLRHSFISTLANSEVPADVRKQIVGHSSEDIHRRYVHLDLMLQQKAIANLPSLL